MTFRRPPALTASLLVVLFILGPSSVFAQLTGSGGKTIPEILKQKTAATANPSTKPGSTWSFLPLEACKVESFRADHPEYDGRGTIILIFDTGIDPGLQGLDSTSTGHQKIVQLVDFSGTGDVSYREATRVGDELRQDGTTVLRGLPPQHSKDPAGKYYYGALPELRFRDGLGDLNFNDTKTDTFGVLLFEDTSSASPHHFSAIVDADGDRNLKSERWISNFSEQFELFQFRPHDTTGTEKRRLNGAVTIDPTNRIVNLFFDDGSHGSHVAGIAAGHNIDGVQGFDGVAPGAELIGVKISENTSGGTSTTGSMQKAFRFAAELARSQSKPVIVNMSFGIGNELEGNAAMDIWLDSLLEDNPNLTVCIAAGNEGPSLSTIGLPGSANRVITSGAMLPAEAARDLFGVIESKPLIFDFSSRGGELAKPDILSPGVAVSTVPDYVGGDRYSGTSMASPFTAGCAAVLLGAMRENFQGYIPDAFALKRAMELSATHLEGATPLDEGYGLINVPKAFELLSGWYAAHSEHESFAIRAYDPTTREKSRAAYFRNGFISGSKDRVVFQVSPEPADTSDASPHAYMFHAFDLESDASWIEPVQSSIYRRGTGGFPIELKYNRELISTPGIYTGIVRGYPKHGRGKHEQSEEAFRLVNTVIVPYEFSRAAGYRIAINDIDLQPGHPARYFFDIPVGTKAYRLTLGTRNPSAIATAYVSDPSGREFDRFSLRDEGVNRFGTHIVTGENCRPGVIEIDLGRSQIGEDEGNARFDFSCEILPLDVTINAATHSPGQDATLMYDIYNGTTRMLEMPIRAEITGYERFVDTLISDGDAFVYEFHQHLGEKSAEFVIELPKEDYDLFTDLSLRIGIPDSDALFNSAFDYHAKTAKVPFGGDTTTKYKLTLTGAIALPDHSHPFHLHIQERRVLESSFTSSQNAIADLAPGATSRSTASFETASARIPHGYRYFGELSARAGGEIRLEIPFHF